MFKTIFNNNQYQHIIEWATTPYKNGLTYKNIDMVSIDNLTTKELRRIAQQNEKKWGNKIINADKNNNWTTRVGEGIVHDVLLKMGKHPKRVKKIDGCCYNPDWETDDAIWEVKSRTWTTSGTAGEKVLGTMYKYSDLPRIYGKPLHIICVAYQEYELSNGTTRIFGELSENKQKFINLAKSMNIEYMKFSDLVKDIDIEPSNCKQSPP